MDRRDFLILATAWLTSSGCVSVTKVPVEDKVTKVPVERSEYDILLELIAERHELTGVKYDKMPPVKFEDMGFFGVARYDVEDEIIYLSLGYEDNDRYGLPRDLSETSEISNVLSHELAHYLTDLYIKKYVPDSWLAPYFEKELKDGEENHGIYIVGEGIAEYFGNIISPGSTRFATYRWYDKFHTEEFDGGNFRTWIWYMGGRDVVEPILKKNAHKGLIWLLNNELDIRPPDLSVVPEYKARALKELSE